MIEERAGSVSFEFSTQSVRVSSCHYQHVTPSGSAGPFLRSTLMLRLVTQGMRHLFRRETGDRVNLLEPPPCFKPFKGLSEREDVANSRQSD